MKNKKKGFTLIELLAVIIILGVLMLIAIPSVTEYISNSRKSTYLSTASAYINAVAVKVNAGADGGLSFVTDPAIAYYVPVSNVAANSCVSLEKGGKSPYGNWDEAYVIVTINATGTAYSYYFTALDDAGYGMDPLKESAWSKSDVVGGATVTFPAADSVVGTPGDEVTLGGTDYDVEMVVVSAGVCSLD